MIFENVTDFLRQQDYMTTRLQGFGSLRLSKCQTQDFDKLSHSST